MTRTLTTSARRVLDLTRHEKTKQSPTDGRFVSEPLKDRFKRKYLKVASGCWEWQSTGSKERDSYRAQIRVNGKYKYAARVSYELNVGPIPPGLLVLHKCDNMRCVNPKHLFLGTHRDNVLDAISKGRFTQHLKNLEVLNKGANHGA